jgi:N6-adenosine-specific RNA methylase IME4/ParB-like chromosome segregation protein Spo0J
VTYPVHPAATLFPMMDAVALQALADDIREHGQREPVILFHGEVLDGRNRLRACELAGVEPWVETRDDANVGDSPAAFVLSLNLLRRHLDESQRAMVGGRAKPLFEAEAATRMRATLRVGAASPAPANLPERRSAPGESREHAAAQVSVSPRSVAHASKVLAHGAPALVAAVDRGEVAVSTAAEIARSLPVAEQTELVARGEKEILRASKEIRARRAEERRDERMETLAAIATGNRGLDGVGTYPVIFADPPWRYDYAETDNRVIENQYPTMVIEDICALPVASIATDDCVLFLWATSPKLIEALDVVKAWGFTYKTCMVWAKDKIGMGYYARQQHELLLIATRGAPPTPAPADRPSSVITAARGEHSAKPDEFYAVIERMYPALPKIELFCRSPRDGWSAWGNQS